MEITVVLAVRQRAAHADDTVAHQHGAGPRRRRP
jgi:hypothetical protein